MKAQVLAVALAVFASGAAVAQDVPKPQILVHADAGNVQVGGAAVTPDTSVGVNAGDTITVSQGQATVTYANGCSITVTGSYVAAATAPACHGASVATASGGLKVAGALGALVLVGVAVGSGGGGDDRPSSP